MSSQYLHQDELNFKVDEILTDDLINTNSYDESKITKKIKTFSTADQTIFLKIALQCSLIGYGGKNYGQVKVNGTEIEIEKLLDKYNIKTYELNSKLNPDDLSIRRLIRIFRYQIMKFSKDNDYSSSLYRKYGNSVKKHYFIFPGAEHVVEEKEDAINLIKAYEKLDAEKGTKFVSRIKGILRARNIKFE